MSSPASFSSREKKAPRESEPLFSFLPYLPTSANVTKPAASSAFALKLRSPSSSALALAKRNVETARASSFSVVSANDRRVSGANESATVLANALPLPFLGVNSSSLSLVSVNTPAASAAARYLADSLGLGGASCHLHTAAAFDRARFFLLVWVLTVCSGPQLSALVGPRLAQYSNDMLDIQFVATFLLASMVAALFICLTAANTGARRSRVPSSAAEQRSSATYRICATSADSAAVLFIHQGSQVGHRLPFTPRLPVGWKLSVSLPLPCDSC
jgi:hypothetical protein